MSKSSKKILLIVFVLVLGYVGLASIGLSMPGVMYDEALHINAALGGLDETFIYKEVFGIPVLLMPYIGGLKAYVTAPFFWLFGVNPISIRLPLILITAGTLGLFFSTVRRFFNKRVALITLALTATAPTVIQSTRTDSGPVVLGLLMMVAALLGLHAYIKNRKTWGLILLIAALALGLFHKLNFIWFVNSLVAGTIFFYGRELYQHFSSKTSKRLRNILIGLGALIAIAAIVGYYVLASQRFALFGALDFATFDWQLRIYNVTTNLWRLINGELYFSYVFGDRPTLAGWVVSFATYALLLAGLATAMLRKSLRYRREYFFFVFLFVTTVVQIFITRNAAWPWHIFTVYPSLTVLLAYSVYAVGDLVGALKPMLKKSWYIISIGLFVTYNLVINATYIGAYKEPVKNVYWSPAIYELIDYTGDQDHKYVSIDWGTHTQLLTFSEDPDKYLNESFRLNQHELTGTAYWSFATEYLYNADEYRFILHRESKSLFPNARTNFFAVVEGVGLAANLEHTITEDGRVVFEIYNVTQPD